MTKLFGKRIIGTTDDIKKIYNDDKNIEFIIAIGNNEIRSRIFNANNVKYYTAIHKNSIISKTAQIGKGSCVMAGAIVGTNAVIGQNCIINTGSIVEHGCKIEDGVHLSYRVTIGAESIIGKESYIGMGAIINRNIEIMPYEDIEIGQIVKGEK